MSKLEKLRTSCLARGGTADIFLWKENQILKLYHQGCTQQSIQQEVVNTNTARNLGILTPEILEIVKVDARLGIVMTKVDGMTMFELLLQSAEQVKHLARVLAQLQVQLHSYKVNGLPEQKKRLQQKISQLSLPADIKTTVRQKLATLPEDNTFCHGDFHPQNMIISQDKPIIIDWFDATQGHPLADVARTLLILNYGQLPTFIEAKLHSQINLIRKQFSDAYINEYNELRSINFDELESWKLAIATARLTEKISIDEQKIMINVIKNLLNK